VKKLLTEKELKIASMKLKGLANKEIATELNVSEPYISQTLAKIRLKIRSVKDSVSLLTQMGLLPKEPMLILTEKGRELATIDSNKLSTRYTTVKTKQHISVKIPFGNYIFPTSANYLKIYGASLIQKSLSQNKLEKKTYKETELKQIAA